MENLGLLIGLVAIVGIFTICLEFQKVKMKKLLNLKRYEVSLHKKELASARAESKQNERKFKIMKELLFYQTLGLSPSRENVLRMKSNILRDLDWLSEQEKLYPKLRSKLTGEGVDYLEDTGDILKAISEEIDFSLRGYLDERRALYQQLADYLGYCGLCFNGQEAESELSARERNLRM